MKNTVKVMFMSLIASLLLLFSCSLAPQDTGDITLRLPTARTAGASYTITLIDSSGNEQSFTTSEKTYKIEKILIGTYTIFVSGTDGINEYVTKDDNGVKYTVKPGPNTVSIPLKLVDIDVPPSGDKEIRSFTVTPKKDAFALYGSTMKASISNFDKLEFLDITEYYTDGTSKVVKDYSNYELEANDTLYNKKIETLDYIDIKVIYIPKKESVITSIPVKFELKSPVIEVKPSQNIKVPQSSKNDYITVNITNINEYPENSIIVRHDWYVKSESGFTPLNKHNPTLSFGTQTTSHNVYKCDVTLSLEEQFKKNCINPNPITVSTPDITVEVVETTVPPTPTPGPDPENPAVTLETISATPKENIYALYGSTVRNTIQEFDSLSFLYITERYSDGRNEVVKDYSNYMLESNDQVYDNKITTLNNISFNIIHKPTNKSVPVQVPVKFNLSGPKITTTPADTLRPNKDDQVEISTNLVWPTELPNDVYTFSYQWYKKNSDTNTFAPVENATNTTYSPDTSIVGNAIYKCGVKTTVKDNFINKCANETSLETYSPEITVEVVETTVPPTPEPEPQLTSIEVEILNSIIYGSEVKINDFAFSKVYDNGDVVPDENYSDYTILSPRGKITTIGNTKVKIKHLPSDIISSIDVPCVYSLPNITQVTGPAPTYEIKQNESKTFTASCQLAASDMPKDQYKISYILLEKIQSTGNIRNDYSVFQTFTTPTITIPSAKVGKETYAIRAKIEPIDSNNCLEFEKSNMSSDFTVTVRSNTTAPTAISILPKDATKYAIFAEHLDMTNFTITETRNGTPKVITTFTDYNITPDIVNDDSFATNGNNIVVKITHKDDPTITSSCEIPCKFKLGTPEVSISPKGTVNILKGDAAPQFTATVKVPSAPLNSYNIAYEWFKDNVKTNITTSTYTLPNTATVGNTNIKCRIIITSKSPTDCLDSDKIHEATSLETVVNISEFNSNNITSFAALKKAITTAQDYSSITLASDIEMSEPLTVNKNITIKASKPVTLKRGSNNKGNLFSVSNVTLNLGDPNNLNTPNVITVDGNRSIVKDAASMVKVPEGTRFNAYNCVFQNNADTVTGGGAIFSDHGQLILTKVKFDNNSSTKNGGALYIITGKSNMTNVSFTNNESGESGGAMAFTEGCSEVSINNDDALYPITNNTAANFGGGMYVKGGAVVIQKGSIANNKCTSGNGTNVYLQATKTTSGNVSLNNTTLTKDIGLNETVTRATKPQ